MKLIQISSPEWRDLKHSIEAGSTPAGAFLVLGPSEEMAVQAQAVLEDTFQRGYPVRYFLCSDSGVFRVPCFLPFPGKQPPPEPLDVSRLLEARLNTLGVIVRSSVHEAGREMEQSVFSESQGPQLILLEYLTPPAELDIAFTRYLLKSVLPRYIPIVMLVHQQNYSDHISWKDPDRVESILYMLYLCGGRVHQADWGSLIAQFPEQSLHDRFIASRQVGSDTWICYANRQVAERAEGIFQRMEQGRRYELARSLFQTLPHCTGYPLLAIASETDDLEAMLSVYSQGAAETALTEPEGVIRYFDRLQQVAQTAGDATATSEAHILSLTAQIFLSEAHTVQVYKRLRGALPGNIDKETGKLFWYILGQGLVIMEHPEAWEYAAECFRLCRECMKSMDPVSQGVVQQSLAKVANGEALIAYKLRQGEKARELEEFALAQLKDMAWSLTFQAHIRINLGDVFLRSFGDVEGALIQYGEALLSLSEARKKLKHQLSPEQVRPSRQRASLKLGNALIQVERYEEAIEILEHLLAYLEKAPGLRRVGEEHAAEVFKTRLALAQAYLKGGQPGRAALCYWHILRHPQWLDPAALREVVTKLGDCRPALHELMQRRMDRIVSEQEAIMASAMKVQEVLTEM